MYYQFNWQLASKHRYFKYYLATDAVLAIRKVLQLAATAHRSSSHSGAAANEVRAPPTGTIPVVQRASGEHDPVEEAEVARADRVPPREELQVRRD